MRWKGFKTIEQINREIESKERIVKKAKAWIVAGLGFGLIAILLLSGVEI